MAALYELIPNQDGSQHTKYPDGSKEDEVPELDAPINTYTSDLTTTSFVLNWQYGNTGHSGFGVEYRVAGGNWISDGDVVGASAVNRVLTDLASSTDYEARVRAFVDDQIHDRVYSSWSPIAAARTQGIIVTPPPGGVTDLNAISFVMDYNEVPDGSTQPGSSNTNKLVTSTPSLGGNKVVREQLSQGQEGFGWQKDLRSEGIPVLQPGDEIWFRTYSYFPSGWNPNTDNYHRKHQRVRMRDEKSAGSNDYHVVNRGNSNQPGSTAGSMTSNFEDNHNVRHTSYEVPSPNHTDREVWVYTEQYCLLGQPSGQGVNKYWAGNGDRLYWLNEPDQWERRMQNTSNRSNLGPGANHVELGGWWNGSCPVSQHWYWGRIAVAIRSSRLGIDDTPHMARDQFGFPYIGTVV